MIFQMERLSTLGYVDFENHHWPAVGCFDFHLDLHILGYFLTHCPSP